MDRRAEMERLRLEADTIMTRYEVVQSALAGAREESGEHWDSGELEVTLVTPSGEEIEVTLDFEGDPASNAESRYERAADLEAELERRAAITSDLEPVPATPLAYLICYHLETVGGNYPRSIAGHLDAERGRIETLCQSLEAGGILERVESGTIKQRRAKAKQSEEVRQHHTYYRLSREGDHLLRFLGEREGKVNVLRHLPDALTLLQRLVREGPADPRSTAETTAMDFEHARHCYRVLQRIGLVVESAAQSTGGSEAASRDGQSGGSNQPRYAPTDRAAECLSAVEG